MAGVSGDFAKLQAIRRRVARIRDPAFRREFLQQLAEEARYQLQESFAGSKDPYDRPWAPLKRRIGQPLRDTGRLQNSFTATVTANRIEVSSRAHYASFHNFGTRRIPVRSFLPNGSLGPRWTRAFVRIAEAFRKMHMRGT